MRLKKKPFIAGLLTLAIVLTSTFFILNFPNLPDHKQDATADSVESPDIPDTVPEDDTHQSDNALIETPVPGSNIPHHLPNDMQQTPAEQYTTHFARQEFMCDGNDCSGFPVEMDAAFMEKLEALRNTLGHPIVITSGVRCENRNNQVGGVPASLHLSGLAADLYCPDVPYYEVASAARTLGLGVIEYPSELYCHVEYK